MRFAVLDETGAELGHTYYARGWVEALNGALAFENAHTLVIDVADGHGITLRAGNERIGYHDIPCAVDGPCELRFAAGGVAFDVSQS